MKKKNMTIIGQGLPYSKEQSNFNFEHDISNIITGNSNSPSLGSSKLYLDQPFGLIPRDCNSLRANSLNQLPRLIPSALANSDSCSLNSGGMRIWNVGDNPSPLGDLSLLIVDMYVRILLIWLSLRTYINITNVKIATPRSASNTIEAFNHNVIRGNTMAMYKSTQTHSKFIWRFAECHKNKATYYLVTAHTENEARSMLPNLSLVFTARIRVGVAHA